MSMRLYASRVAIAGALAIAAPAFAQDADTMDTDTMDQPSQTRDQKSMPGKAKASDHAMMKPTREEAMNALAGWQETPRKTGEAIIAKYGAPNEMTPTRMVWLNNGPWKWSILTNDPTQHDFPVAHEDVLEQAISYDIPVDKVDELATYDGSVVANRTQGELSARCDKEGANFLALNLANDVAKGAKSVEAARTYYAKAIDAFIKEDKMDAYMTGLKFDAAAPAAAMDADKSASL